MCCYACGTAKEDFAMHPISTYSTVLVKNKKININILIAKGGLEPLQPPSPACAFAHVRCVCMYKSCVAHLAKWTNLFAKFRCFA